MQRNIPSARDDHAAEHIERKRKMKQRNISSAREDHAADHIKCKRRSRSGACQVQEGHGLLLRLPPPPRNPPETHVEDMWGAADRKTNNATRHRSPDVAIERKMKIMQRNISIAREDHAAEHIKRKRRSIMQRSMSSARRAWFVIMPGPPPTPKPPRNPCWRHVGRRR